MVKVDKICRMMSFPLAVIALAACEIVDDDMDRHVSDSMYVSLDDVAKVLSHAPIGKEHILEVKAAVSSSSGNGYDEEYTVSDMFTCPGAGVGDDIAVRGMGDARTYAYPLSRLIEDYVRSSPLVRSSDGIGDPEKWLKGLTDALLDSKEITAFCYTQLTDVEQEVNGLYTYDRVPKFNPATIHAIISRKAPIED